MVALLLVLSQAIGGENSGGTLLLPIGTVTGMLVVTLGILIRRQWQLDKFYQKMQEEARESLESELERSAAERRTLQLQLLDSEKRCEKKIERLERDYQAHKKFAYNRIRDLETSLYGQPRTPAPPEDSDGGG